MTYQEWKLQREFKKDTTQLGIFPTGKFSMIPRDKVRRIGLFDNAPRLGFAVQAAEETETIHFEDGGCIVGKWEFWFCGNQDYVFLFSYKGEAISWAKALRDMFPNRELSFSITDIRSTEMTSEEYEDYLVDMSEEAYIRRCEG